jgi:hypothetical protein
MSSLAVTAALRANPPGAAAWGCGIVLAGGALFLASEQNRWLARALLIGAWGISALPFSLTATGWTRVGVTPLLGWLAWPFLIAAHAMLVAGFVRHSQRVSTRPANEEQPIWAKNVYPIGIGLLLATIIGLGLFGWSGTLQLGSWFVAVLVALLAVGTLWLTPRLRILNPVRAHWVQPASSTWLDQLYLAVWNLYRRLGRISRGISDVLEGESGIMWTLVFLALFISIFAGREP